MLKEEARLWDVKRLRDRNKRRADLGNVKQLQARIAAQIKYENTRFPRRLGPPKARQETEYAKSLELVENLKREDERFNMMQCDVEGLYFRYHDVSLFQRVVEMKLTTGQEFHMNTLLHKYQIRLTGVTKDMVDVLHEHPSAELTTPQRAERIWELHKAIARLVGGQSKLEPIVWPLSRNVLEVMLTLQLIEHQSAILNHLGDIKSRPRELRAMSSAYNICSKVLMLLRDWPDEDEMDLLFHQLFKSFRNVLTSEYFNLLDLSSFPVSYLDLSRELVWWLESMVNGRRFTREGLQYYPNHIADLSGLCVDMYMDSNIHLAMPVDAWRSGFFIPLMRAYPDVLFMARSLSMLLIFKVHDLRTVGAGSRDASRNNSTSTASNAYNAPIKDPKNASIGVRESSFSVPPSRSPSKAFTNEDKSEQQRRGLQKEHSISSDTSASSSYYESRDKNKLHLQHMHSSASSASEFADSNEEGYQPMQSKDLNDEALHMRCIDSLISASLDLSLCLVLPLRDVFCSIRRLPITDFRYLECTEMCVVESLRLISTLFSGLLSTYKFKPNLTGRFGSTSRRNRDGDATMPAKVKTQLDLRDEGMAISPENTIKFLTKTLPLFNSCARVTISRIENVQLQTALIQSSTIIAIYIIEEEAFFSEKLRLAGEVFADFRSCMAELDAVAMSMGGETSQRTCSNPKYNNLTAKEKQGLWQSLSAAATEKQGDIYSEYKRSMVSIASKIIACMELHKDTPSLLQMGLLFLRLVLQPPFFLQNNLEDFLSEAPTYVYHDQHGHSERTAAFKAKSGDGEGGGKQNRRGERSRTNSSGNNSDDDDGGDDNDDDDEYNTGVREIESNDLATDPMNKPTTITSGNSNNSSRGNSATKRRDKAKLLQRTSKAKPERNDDEEDSSDDSDGPDELERDLHAATPGGPLIVVPGAAKYLKEKAKMETFSGSATTPGDTLSNMVLKRRSSMAGSAMGVNARRQSVSTASTKPEATQASGMSFAEVKMAEATKIDNIFSWMKNEAETCEAHARVYVMQQPKEHSRRSLATLLYHIGENHNAKLDVLEQYILFLIHIFKASSEGKTILLNIHVDDIIRRIKVLQQYNPYYLALCELYMEISKTFYDAI